MSKLKLQGITSTIVLIIVGVLILGAGIYVVQKKFFSEKYVSPPLSIQSQPAKTSDSIPCTRTSTSTVTLTVHYVERVGEEDMPIRDGMIQAEFINVPGEEEVSMAQGPSTDSKGIAVFRHLTKGTYKINAKGGFRSDEPTDDLPLYTNRRGSKTIDLCFDEVITIKTVTPPPPLVTPVASTTLEIISANQVEWNPADGFSATTDTAIKSSFEDYTIYYHIKTIGIIKNGRYENKELLRIDTTISGDYYRGKGLGSGDNVVPGARFVKNGETMIFLPKISQLYTRDEYERGGNPFEKIGLNLIVDPNFSIPILEFPAAISGPNPRQHLISDLAIEEFGNLDTAKLVKVFRHEIFGDIYTSKSDASNTASFYYDEYYFSLGYASVEGCNGESCFLTNGFYAFRPDGTFLKYFYSPDFSYKEIVWDDNTTSSVEYDYVTRFGGCSKKMLNYNSIIDSTVLHNGNDLVVAGYNKMGDSIYVLRDNNHPLLLEFYENYKKYFFDWREFNPQPTTVQPVTYETFLGARPVFFWYDPLGRIVRYQNSEFLPPGACEPIIYLYPPTTQKVSVLIQPYGRITNSTPNYNSGWEVMAEPSGKIRDISSQKVYPYLFWEGWSWIFPMQDKGFVVNQSDIHKFFLQILPKLGLKDNEASDFMLAWEHRFTDAPYYFITFYDKDFIDYFAPLIISPKPDTVIRILMDYKPLNNPISVKPINIRTPERRGFTVVEWGGLIR